MLYAKPLLAGLIILFLAPLFSNPASAQGNTESRVMEAYRTKQSELQTVLSETNARLAEGPTGTEKSKLERTKWRTEAGLRVVNALIDRNLTSMAKLNGYKAELDERRDEFEAGDDSFLTEIYVLKQKVKAIQGSKYKQDPQALATYEKLLAELKEDRIEYREPYRLIRQELVILEALIANPDSYGVGFMARN